MFATKLHSDNLPAIAVDTEVGADSSPNSNRETPIKISPRLSLFTDRFNTKNEVGEFLGETSNERDSLQYCQFIRTSSMARSKFEFEEKGTLVHGRPTQSLQPSHAALVRTERAAIAFFSLAYHMLDKNNEQFPLAGKNKCLGMVAVPNSKLVMIAISQDKKPEKDIILRRQMVDLLDRMNQENTDREFELVCIPTKSQYMMPRTLFMRTTHPAPEEWIKPHTRCVEVALMVALCKIRDGITVDNAGVMALGSTLWKNAHSSDAVEHFGTMERNTKHEKETTILVPLENGETAHLAEWYPCDNHCLKYRKQMNAIAASGGPATSFTEPRSERNLSI